MLLEFKKLSIAENLLGYSSGPLFFDTFCSVYIDASVIYLVWLACTASTLFSAYNFIACTAAPPLKLQMDPPVFFLRWGAAVQRLAILQFWPSRKLGRLRLNKYHRWENTGNHNRGRKFQKITETKQWRRYVLGNLEFFMHFLPVTVSNKLFATNQSFLTLL